MIVVLHAGEKSVSCDRLKKVSLMGGNALVVRWKAFSPCSQAFSVLLLLGCNPNHRGLLRVKGMFVWTGLDWSLLEGLGQVSHCNRWGIASPASNNRLSLPLTSCFQAQMALPKTSVQLTTVDAEV